MTTACQQYDYKLPWELWDQLIFPHLPVFDLIKSTGVCKGWMVLIQNNKQWNDLVQKCKLIETSEEMTAYKKMLKVLKQAAPFMNSSLSDVNDLMRNPPKVRWMYHIYEAKIRNMRTSDPDRAQEFQEISNQEKNKQISVEKKLKEIFSATILFIWVIPEQKPEFAKKAEHIAYLLVKNPFSDSKPLDRLAETYFELGWITPAKKAALSSGFSELLIKINQYFEAKKGQERAK